MALKVIGAGFGRTGTLSFKAALEELGFGPCYHMLEVRKHETHSRDWHHAVDHEDTDWQQLLSGYQSAVDWPACYFWRQLIDAFPDAKVILTVRDADRWYDSISQTILPALQEPPTNPDRHAMGQAVIMNGTFAGRLDDRAYATEIFTRHIAAVQASVPPEKLLTYEVAEGWGPLAEFLSVPVPKSEFPRVNSTAEFRVMVGLDKTESTRS
jgi:hypothetical protein